MSDEQSGVGVLRVDECEKPGVGVLRVDECEQPGVGECEWHTCAYKLNLPWMR